MWSYFAAPAVADQRDRAPHPAIGIAEARILTTEVQTDFCAAERQRVEMGQLACHTPAPNWSGMHQSVHPLGPGPQARGFLGTFHP